MVRIVLFALFVTVYGDISHLYDPPRASEVNLIHQLDVDDRPVPIVQEPHAFQAPAVVQPPLDTLQGPNEEPIVPSPSYASEQSHQGIDPSKQYVFFPLEALLRWQQSNGFALFPQLSAPQPSVTFSPNSNNEIISSTPQPQSSSTHAPVETTTAEPIVSHQALQSNEEIVAIQAPQSDEEIVFVRPIPKAAPTEGPEEQVAQLIEQLSVSSESPTPIRQTPATQVPLVQSTENDQSNDESFSAPSLELQAPRFSEPSSLYKSPNSNILARLRLRRPQIRPQKHSIPQEIRTTPSPAPIEISTTASIPTTYIPPPMQTTYIPPPTPAPTTYIPPPTQAPTTYIPPPTQAPTTYIPPSVPTTYIPPSTSSAPLPTTTESAPVQVTYKSYNLPPILSSVVIDEPIQKFSHSEAEQSLPVAAALQPNSYYSYVPPSTTTIAPDTALDEELQSIIVNAQMSQHVPQLELYANAKLPLVAMQTPHTEIIFSHVLTEHEGYKYKIIGIKTN